jgi:hypothetical protein
VIHADADVLAFVRRHEGQAVAGLFNLSSRPVALPEGLAIAGQVLASVNGASLEKRATCRATADCWSRFRDRPPIAYLCVVQVWNDRANGVLEGMAPVRTKP